MAGSNRGERGRGGGHGIVIPDHTPASMMNSRSTWRWARPSSGGAALLRGARLFFACASALLLVALSSAPSTAVAQAGERSTDHCGAQRAAVAGAPCGAVLDPASAHAPDLWVHAVRSAALPPDEHDVDTERDTKSRLYANTQGHSSDAAYCQPGGSLRRSVAVGHPPRFVAFELEAAPAGDCLSRAPPGD